MSKRRSSSDRLGPSPSGRTEVMETGFSSRVASPLRLSGGASGEVASRVSIAASVVVSRRTPPEAGPAGPYLRVNRASRARPKIPIRRLRRIRGASVHPRCSRGRATQRYRGRPEASTAAPHQAHRPFLDEPLTLLLALAVLGDAHAPRVALVARDDRGVVARPAGDVPA